MKKYLLSLGTYYKANLHAHSTVSDGQLTPAQLKEEYKKHGYSILAVTDHELVVDHSDLSDKDFLMLTGFEYAVCEDLDGYVHSKTIEFNMFARDPHNVTQVCFDPSTVIHGDIWRADVAKLTEEGIVKKEYTPEFLQHVIDEGRAHGFLVSLNHPHTSMETIEMFKHFDGLFAMEIYNHIGFIHGTYDYNPQVYDQMLRLGKNIWCIAADDCHSDCPDTDPICDKFGGFVMLHADKLEYGAVIDALERGDFYSSEGPEIRGLYVEDNKVHVLTSPAKFITICTGHRHNWIAAAKKDETITEAVFDLPIGDPYMRFSVTDREGNHADTHAYCPDDYKE